VRRKLITLVAAAVVAAGFAVLGSQWGSVSAQETSGKGPLNVVALGDSYGSGTGAGDYLDGTGVAGGCWRSANSYSQTIVERLLAAGKQVSFKNVTCSGAATADLSQSFKGEAPQLDALQGNTHLVFLSVGTNDIDFATYGGTCIAADCSGPVTQAELAELPGMGQNVAALLDVIKERSPWAKIVMTGYGRQLTAGENAAGVPLDPICDPAYFSSQERIDGNQVASGIDATLRQTASQAGVTFVSPYTANSVDLQPSFVGHSLCEAGAPLYRGFDALAPGQEGQEAVLHLNATGQTVLADLVQGNLR
jgi:lysophospholipase L1-like esterase